MAAPGVPYWQRAIRVFWVIFTGLVVLLQIPRILRSDEPQWLVVGPVLLFTGFAGLMWWSRGQFRGASKDHPVEGRNRRGLAMSITWLLILAELLIRRAVHGSNWLLLGVIAIALLFTIGAIAEAAAIVPRDQNGEQAPDGPAEDLTAP